jgi:hypothetical protein
MKRLILLDQTTKGDIGGDRTKQQKGNFKTGALNHSATLPARLVSDSNLITSSYIGKTE